MSKIMTAVTNEKERDTKINVSTSKEVTTPSSNRATDKKVKENLQTFTGVKKVIKNHRSSLFTSSSNLKRELTTYPLGNLRGVEMQFSFIELKDMVKNNLKNLIVDEVPEGMIEDVEILSNIKEFKNQTSIVLRLNKDHVVDTLKVGNFFDTMDGLSETQIDFEKILPLRSILSNFKQVTIIDEKVYVELDYIRILTEVILKNAIVSFNKEDIISENFAYSYKVDKNLVAFGVNRILNIKASLDKVTSLCNDMGSFISLPNDNIYSIEFMFNTQEVANFLLNKYRLNGILEVGFVDPIQTNILGNLQKPADIVYYRAALLSSDGADREVKVDQIPIIIIPKNRFYNMNQVTSTWLDNLTSNVIDEKGIYDTFIEVLNSNHRLIPLVTRKGYAIVPELSSVLRLMANMDKSKKINFICNGGVYQVIFSVL